MKFGNSGPLGIDQEPPVGSVVHDAAGDLWQRHAGGWWMVGLETFRRKLPVGTPGAPWSAMVGYRRGPVALAIGVDLLHLGKPHPND